MIPGISERLQQKPVTWTYIHCQSLLELCQIKKYVQGKKSNDSRAIKKIFHSELIKS